MDLNLKGRRALVTGGSKGIGRACAQALAEEGCSVTIASRDAQTLAAAAAEIKAKTGAEVQCRPADLSQRGVAEQLAADVGELDILVNNAGAAWGAPFEEFPEHGWDKVMDLNLKSPFFLTQALHVALKKAGTHDQPAKVINIASIDGIRLNPQDTYSYHASKSGLIYLTRRLAARLIADNIVVSAIAPGAFASEMNRTARDHGDAVAKAIPARRIGRDEDMAGAAIYLASRAGNYVVGETIAVDGGVALATVGAIG